MQLDEAVQLLARYAENARVLSGGQSLIPMLNFRLLAPEALVDLRRVPGLAEIRIVHDTLCIGAMTRQRAASSIALQAAIERLMKQCTLPLMNFSDAAFASAGAPERRIAARAA